MTKTSASPSLQLSKKESMKAIYFLRCRLMYVSQFLYAGQKLVIICKSITLIDGTGNDCMLASDELGISGACMI